MRVHCIYTLKSGPAKTRPARPLATAMCYDCRCTYHLRVHVYTTSSVITQDGGSALMKAASGGHTGIVAELVKARSNLDLQDKVCHC